VRTSFLITGGKGDGVAALLLISRGGPVSPGWVDDRRWEGAPGSNAILGKQL
jgi:hypothetical protein